MSQHIGFRCPDDLIAAIQAEAENNNKDRTTIILEALRRGFNLSSPIDSETSQLKLELNAVKQRLDALEGKWAA